MPQPLSAPEAGHNANGNTVERDNRSSTALIDLKDVGLTIGNLEILRSIDFQIGQGEFVCVVGHLEAARPRRCG